MHSEFTYLLYIAIILAFAKIGGLFSKKLGQPEVLGQIIAGVVLGTLFLEKTELVDHLAEIGVIFLMFVAGLETDVKELKESSKSSSLIASGEVVFTLILVTLGTYLYTKSLSLAFFMAVISTATSVSISVQTLREIGQLRTKQGVTILGAAIIDDIGGIVIFTLSLSVLAKGSGSGVLMVVGKILLFFLITVAVGFVILKLFGKYKEFFYIEEKSITIAIVMCFVLAFLSEELGVAAITGAYFSGLVFGMTSERHRITHEINKISKYIFTPIFFVAIGMGVDLRSTLSALGVGVIIIVLSTLGKVFGGATGAVLSGFNKREALQIGIGMIPRAEVSIIIANIGLRLGLIGDKELSAVILMVLVTTLITPSLLKWSFERK